MTRIFKCFKVTLSSQHEGRNLRSLVLTLSGILNVRFFSFFSVTRSVLAWLFTFESDELPKPPSTCKFSELSSDTFRGLASTDMLGDAKVEFSTVIFFLGTSTHSEISITASARSKENMPLLLREKWRLALIGEDIFRAEYLKNKRTTQGSNTRRTS